jgi:hypothetical protein
METRESLQAEKFGTYYLALCLIAGLVLLECFLGWYLVFQEYGKFSFVRILLTMAILIGLWVQSHAARYLGSIWLLFSVGVLIWFLFTSQNVALNFAAFLVFLVAALSVISSYIILFSKHFRSEFARQEKRQPDYKRVLSKTLSALVILLFIVASLNDIHRFFFK